MTIEIPALDDNDVGFGDEDKGRITSNRNDWYKGEKGRTDRVALVYFNTHVIAQVRKAVRAKPDLTSSQKTEMATKVRVTIAEKLKKSLDQLDDVDLLDTSEVRVKTVTASFKKEVGFVAWPKTPLGADDQKVWSRLGEKRDYVITLLLVYPTDRDGDVDPDTVSKRWFVKPWRFPADKYDVLRKIDRGLREGGSNLASVDLLLTCSDAQFQKITITHAGPAIYRRDEAFRRRVLEAAVAQYEKLKPFRELTTDELREKLGVPAAGGIVKPGSDDLDLSALVV